MLISHKYKFITIDIPKTGTRSFRQTLLSLNMIDTHGEPSLDSEFYQHGSAIDAQKQFIKKGWGWNEYFKFTIVRNPWVRYFSFFKYFKTYAEAYLCRDKSINWKKPEINQGKLCVKLFENKDYQTVLKNIILNNHAQDTYYCDTNGDLMVDHIASFENLKNEFVFLCNQVGIKTPILQHENKSSNSQIIHDIYNQELIDFVARKEKSVIDLIGYDYIT